MIFPFITAVSKVCYLLVTFFILQIREKRFVGEFLIQPVIFQGNIYGNLIWRPIRSCKHINGLFLIIFHSAFVIFINDRFLIYIHYIIDCCFIGCTSVRSISIRSLCLTACQHNNPDNYNDHCPIKQFIL